MIRWCTSIDAVIDERRVIALGYLSELEDCRRAWYEFFAIGPVDGS